MKKIYEMPSVSIIPTEQDVIRTSEATGDWIWEDNKLV